MIINEYKEGLFQGSLCLLGSSVLQSFEVTGFRVEEFVLVAGPVVYTVAWSGVREAPACN